MKELLNIFMDCFWTGMYLWEKFWNILGLIVMRSPRIWIIKCSCLICWLVLFLLYLFYCICTADNFRKRVFILGPSHHVRMSGCALSGTETYQTPLYDLTIDRESKYPWKMGNLINLTRQSVSRGLQEMRH